MDSNVLNLMALFLAVARKSFCTSSTDNGDTHRCLVKQPIGTEDYDLGIELKSSVKRFDISGNRDVKFLPRLISEKFPNLTEFRALSCALTVLRSHYFQDMNNLRYLGLSENKIASIEPEAFKDLVNVRKLYLNDNRIETLDEKLFVAMVNLRNLYLLDNKIRFVSPATFDIPNGQLYAVDLRSNICIDEDYFVSRFEQMTSDIRANCTR